MTRSTSRHRILLGYCVGRQNRLDFSVRDRNWLFFVWASKMPSVRSWIDFFVCVEDHRNWLVLTVCIGIDLTSGLESKSFGFCMEGPNWLGFIVATKLDLFFVRGSKLTSLLCAGRKWLFSVRGSIDPVFVWVVKTDLLSVWVMELDLFSVKGWNWFGACVGGRS